MKYFLSIAVLVFTFQLSAQQLHINELMSSNSTVFADLDGDFSDWIELYNAGTADINLLGYGITDNELYPYKWVFPNVIIPSGAYLVVWASGKNYRSDSENLHTNFSISVDGEKILLTSPNGQTISESPAVFLANNISWGRFPDGGAQFCFFETATPGMSNNANAYTEILSPVQFSKEAGFYNESFKLTLTHPDPDVCIVYTLDGSEPDINNVEGKSYFYKNSYPEKSGDTIGELLERKYQSIIYDAPIDVYERSNDENSISNISTTFHFQPNYFPVEKLSKSLVVRARAYKQSAISRDICTKTYFVFPEGNPHKIPVISLAVPEAALFDYDKGIYVAGKLFDDWRKLYPVGLSNGGSPANYNTLANDSEIFSHIEYFDDTNNKSFATGVGVRLHGAWSREFPLKSLRLYARSEYSNSHFNCNVFSNQYESYKRLILRNSGQDFPSTLMRDGLIHSSVRHLKFDTQAYQPALLYLNGEYWGLHNVRERYDKYYIKRVYDINEDEFDMLSFEQDVEEGDANHFLAMRNYIKNNDIKQSNVYAHVNTLMDVENFIDYHLTQIYIDNRDWPGNNIKFWRKRTSQFEPNSTYGHDGRWRWMLYDTDFCLGRWGYNYYNTLSFATEAGNTDWPNPDWSTFLLRTLLQNESFKNDFINRFADLLNTTFLPIRMRNLIEDYKNEISDEVSRHEKRWPNTIVDKWENHIQNMISFVNERPHYQRKHICDYFGLTVQVDVRLDVDNSKNGYIRINTIDLKPETVGVDTLTYPWSGVYFAGVPITIEAKAAEGYVFSHWEGSVNSTSSKIVIDPIDAQNLKAHFVVKDLIHYWHFNTLSGAQQQVDADSSAVDRAFMTLSGSGSLLDERKYRTVDPVSNFNLFMEQAPNQGAVLRVRNPTVERELLINASTVNYSKISVSFATARLSNGPEKQQFYYSADAGEHWVKVHEAYDVSVLDHMQTDYGYVHKSFDLSHIPQLANNPNLMFKIGFEGSGCDNTSGNTRFDNFSVHGVLPTVNVPDDVIVCNNSEVEEIKFYGAVEGTVFYWTNNNPEIGLAKSGVGNIPAFIAHNDGNTLQNAVIRVSPNSNGVMGDAKIFRLTVKPKVLVHQIETVVINSNDNSVNINFSTELDNVNFTWVNDNPAIGLSESGVGNIGAFIPNHEFGDSGMVANITVIPEYLGCSGEPMQFEIRIDTKTSVENRILASELKVYPLPVKNQLFVEFPTDIIAVLSFDIIDMLGRSLIRSEKASHKTIDNRKFAISVDALQPGMYWLKINIEQNGQPEHWTRKIIVEK